MDYIGGNNNEGERTLTAISAFGDIFMDAHFIE